VQQLLISFDVRSSVLIGAIQQVMHRAITNGMPLVVDFDFSIQLRASSRTFPEKRFSLTSYPPALTKTSMVDLDELHKLTPLTRLRQLDLWCESEMMQRAHSAHDIFQAIGSHNLPELHTLTLDCRSELIIDENGKSHAADHERVCQIMAGMKCLTELTVDHVPSTPRHFRWLEHIHLFPALAILKVENPMLDGEDLSEDTNSQSRLNFLRSISLAPRLEKLTISVFFTPSDFEHLTRVWRERGNPSVISTSQAEQAEEQLDGTRIMRVDALDSNALATTSSIAAASTAESGIVDSSTQSTTSVMHGMEHHSSSSSADIDIGVIDSAPAIHTLDITLWPGDLDDVRVAVRHLVDLARLTDLTLDVWGVGDEEEREPRSLWESHLYELPNLRSLHHLTIEDEHDRLTDSLLQHWSTSGGFLQLRTLTLGKGLHFASNLASSYLLTHVGLAQLLNLPALYSLTIKSMPSITRRALRELVDDANAAGRSPPFEFHVRGDPLDQLQLRSSRSGYLPPIPSSSW
jgi:hypothetical protein